MRWVRFAVLLLVVAVLQADLVDVVAIAGIVPDLLLICLVFFAIYYNTTEAIITSFTIGFAADLIIVGYPMGPQIISFGLFGTLLAYLHRVIAIRKSPNQVIAIFVTCLFAGIGAHFLSLFKGEPAAANVYAVVFGRALYSAVVGPVLFLPLAFWMRIKTHRFSRQ